MKTNIPNDQLNDMVNSPNYRLAAARVLASRRLPYFASFMRMFVFKEVDTTVTKTVVVSDDARFFFNPDFVMRFPIEHLATIILHEVLHVLRRHGAQAKTFGVMPTTDDARIANVAMDFEINDDLAETGAPVEEAGGILPQQYGLPPGLMWQDYYYRLKEILQGADSPEKTALEELIKANTPDESGGYGPGGEGEGEGDEDGEGNGQGGVGAGDCGSCAGNPRPNEPKHDPDSDDDSPQSVEGRTPNEMSRAAADAARQVQAAAGRGGVPGRFKRWADDEVRPPVVNWRTRLARIFGNSMTYVRGTADYYYSRPSRRQSAVGGYAPNTPVLPAMRRSVPKVWVVLDTSGSMGSSEIGDSLSEIGGVIQAAAGAGEVTFISGDCEVGDVVRVRTMAEILPHISGGGGTDFRPPFRLMEMEPKHSRPNILIYCTDGMGPAPTNPPAGCTVVWVLVGPYKTAPAEWGEMVYVERDEVSVIGKNV